MVNKNNIGGYGEDLAIKHLIRSGYTLLNKNFRSKFGEIDIIVLKSEVLSFVEVKTRYNQNYGFPCESVDYKKRKNIIKTSQIFLSAKKFYQYNIRFDVIEVFLNYNDDSYCINHIKSAF